LNKLFKVLLSP